MSTLVLTSQSTNLMHHLTSQSTNLMHHHHHHHQRQTNTTLVNKTNSCKYITSLFYLYINFYISAVADPLRARYLIAHKLASGGFGDVYAGVRKKDGIPVALKVVPKKRMREINTVSFIEKNNFLSKKIFILA